MSDSWYNNNSFEVWNFPALEGQGDSFEPLDAGAHGELNEQDNADVSITTHDNLEERNTLIEHINYLDELGFQMKTLLSEIDASLLGNIVALVRKTVKKVVDRELALDGNVLKDMIDASLAKIHRDDDVCVVHISEADQSIFAEAVPLQHVVIKTDATLQKGDYVIKSRFSELEAILEQRINTLLGI